MIDSLRARCYIEKLLLYTESNALAVFVLFLCLIAFFSLPSFGLTVPHFPPLLFVFSSSLLSSPFRFSWVAWPPLAFWCFLTLIFLLVDSLLSPRSWAFLHPLFLLSDLCRLCSMLFATLFSTITSSSPLFCLRPSNSQIRDICFLSQPCLGNVVTRAHPWKCL